MLTRLTQFQAFWTTGKHFVSYVKHFTNFKPLSRYICNYQPTLNKGNDLFISHK